jgi:hypothetical protein
MLLESTQLPTETCRQAMACQPSVLAQVLREAPGATSFKEISARIGSERLSEICSSATPLELPRGTSLAALARHTLFVSHFCALCVEHYQGSLDGYSSEEAFFLGSIHDVGMLTFSQSQPSESRTVCDFAANASMSFDLAYEALHPTSIVAEGATFVRQNSGNEALALTLLQYGTGFDATWPDIRSALQIANHVATSCGYGWEPWSARSDLPCFVHEALDGNKGTFASLTEKAITLTDNRFPCNEVNKIDHRTSQFFQSANHNCKVIDYSRV